MLSFFFSFCWYVTFFFFISVLSLLHLFITISRLSHVHCYYFHFFIPSSIIIYHFVIIDFYHLAPSISIASSSPISITSILSLRHRQSPIIDFYRFVIIDFHHFVIVFAALSSL